MSWHDFHFLRPLWLLALLPLPFLLGWLWRRAWHGQSWRNVCDPHLLPHLLVELGGGQNRLPLALLGLGWLLAVLALAGPAWEKLPQPVYRAQQAVVLVLDLSRSMDAADLPPSRLARAKYKLQDILERSREGQAALVVYAGDAHTVSPLTSDTATIANLVPPLETALMPVPGSAAHLGLAKAGELLAQGGARNALVVLLGDGVDGADAQEQARRLRAAGHRVSVLAVGTPQGAPVPEAGGGYLKDRDGAIVMPKLDAAPLQALAGAGGGVYVELRADDRDLDALLAGNAPALTAQAAHRQADAWREEGPWLVLLLLPLAALAFRRGWLAGIVLLAGVWPPQPAQALDWAALWQRPDQRGAQALAQDQPEAAAALFDSPEWRGVAHYRAGDYAQAAEDFARLDSAAAHYNRGNALAKLGKLEDARQAYQAALNQAPDDADIRHNLELVEKLLEQQKQQKQQQGPRQPQDSQQGPPQSQEAQGQSGEAGGQDAQDKQDAARPDASQTTPQGPSSQDGQAGPRQPAQSEDAAGGEDRAEQPQEAQAQPEETAQAQSANQEGQPPEDRQAQAAQAGTDPADGTEQQAATASADGQARSEQDQALEQWLQRIPDDPGGLLRRKFLLESQRQKAAGASGEKAW